MTRPVGRGTGLVSVPRVELPGHPVADMELDALVPEGVGHALGQHDLVGGARRRQLAGQHRDLVLPVELPVQAAGQSVGQERVVDLAAG